jgi:hypothetical protein
MSWITLGKPESAGVFEAIKEIETGSDRAAAVVAGSFVEEHLQIAIQCRMVTHEKIIPEMFRPTGALGSFGTKINLGFMVGLYTELARKELDTIKQIRNSFAHRMETRDFTQQRISALANNLVLADQVELYMGAPDRSLAIGSTLVLVFGEKPTEGNFIRFLEPLANPPARQRYIRACKLFIAALAFAPLFKRPDYQVMF